jgi:predicted nucleotidyltransferase
LDEYLEWLRGEFNLRLVILFGSIARGDWTESSDIDLLIVADELSGDAGENFLKLKRYSVEPIGYNTSHFLKEIERPNLLVLDALQYGRVLIADEDYRKDVELKFREVKEKLGLTWTGRTWTWRKETSDRPDPR